MRDYEAHRNTLIPVAGPGHWNDLDMLTGGNFGLSWDETRVQMGMWAMHASPLIMSLDLATVRPEIKEVRLHTLTFSRLALPFPLKLGFTATPMVNRKRLSCLVSPN